MAGHVHVYEAETKHGIHLWKASVRLAGNRMMADKIGLLNYPVRLRILWLFQRPKRLLAGGRQHQHLLYDGGKDVDNLEKALLDALNQVVWTDDRYIADVDKVAMWAGPDDKPGCYMWIARATIRPWVLRMMAPLPTLALQEARPKRRGNAAPSRRARS